MRRLFLLIIFVCVLLFIQIQPGSAQQTAPEPADDTTNFCEEVSGTGTNYPSYCADRDARGAAGGDLVTDPSSPILGPKSIPYRIIQIITIVTGAVSVIMIIVGGFKYVVSGGDSNATKGAKDTILYAVIGLVIALFAQVIITFVLSSL